MAKIIEAKAVISGEEKLSPLLDKLAKKFDQVAKTARGAEGVDKMAAALERVKTQMAAIDKYSATSGRFALARENFRKAAEGVQAAAKAMREGQGDARKLEAEYKRAQSAVQSASRAFEAQKSSVIAAKRGLDELGLSGGRIAEQQLRLASAVDRASAAMDRQHAKAGRLRNVAGNVASTGALLAGPGILAGAKAAVKSGASIVSEQVKMRAAGIPEEDIQRETSASAGLAAKYTNVKRSDILERYKELRSILQHPEEASHLLETTVRANSALNASDRTGRAAEGLTFALKGAEVLGLAQDPKRFEGYLDAFVKAQQVMGKTITPEHIYEFAKYSKASGATLSDRFKMTTGLSLAQEVGGSTAGVGVDQLIKQVVGGFQGSQHAAAKQFVALGLAKKDDFELTKTGEIKGFKPGRHVAGHSLAMTDPDQWIYDYVVPAMERNGIKTLDDKLGMVRRLFPSGRAADVVAKLIQQESSFKNHAKLYEGARGLNAVDGLNATDPFVALNSLSTSLANFAGTVTSPTMERAAGVMDGIAKSFGSWGASFDKWQKQNPAAAEAVGGAAVVGGVAAGGILTYNLVSGLMTGFGLPASAVALDGAAAALTSAAVALGGTGAAGKAAGAASGIGSAAAWGARVAPIVGYGGIAAAAAYGLYGIYDSSSPSAGLNSGERMARARGGSMSDVYRRAFNDDRERLGIPALGAPAGTGAPAKAELSGTAKVTGEAKITIDIPGLPSRTVNVPLNGVIDANGPGSVGVSSPDVRGPR